MSKQKQQSKQAVHRGTWQKPERYQTTDDYIVLGDIDNELSLHAQARLAREQFPDIFNQLGKGDF